MIGKLCQAPKGGASAGSLIEYLVGYAVAEKGASKSEIRDALESVFLEAEQRADRGVGQLWRPEVGRGARPSSVLVRNCDSMSTSALEMDSDALQNPGVRSGAMHFVWSFSAAETKNLTDEQVHSYVGQVLDKLGLAHHRSLAVVHRDTENVHVHCAVGSVDPATGLAYDRTSIYKRMAKAEREVELQNALPHDRGLYVVRDAGTTMARVEEATKDELAAWRAQRTEERLLRMERRTWEAYRDRDVTFARYADASIAPRLRAALERAGETGRDGTWADLHAVAARYGAIIEKDLGGEIVLRDVGIGAMRYEHGRERIDLATRMRLAGEKDRDVIDAAVSEMKAKHAEVEAAERERKMTEGETVTLAAVFEVPENLREFRTVHESETDVVALVESDPSVVLRDLTKTSSTFDRSDIDVWLAQRISDPEQLERLGDLVLHDGSVRMLAADSRWPLYTTTEILAIEDRLAEDAKALVKTDTGITAAHVAKAIELYEQAMTAKKGEPFRVSSEQWNALLSLTKGSLVVTEGLPGTGKTTIQGVIRVLAEDVLKREVMGVSLAQIAAERLAAEAGFKTVNTARARILEGAGEEIVPRNGILTIEEASMIDSRTMQVLLAAARERGTVVNIIHDDRQLAPVDAGQASRITKAIAKDAGTYSELRDIQRQKRDWHKKAVELLADAIVEKSDEKRLSLVRESLGILDTNGAITWAKDRDEAIDTAVKIARVHKAFGYHDTLMPAADRDTVRHLSEEDRRRDGLEGKGLRFVTEGGEREVAVGDTLTFLENSLGKRGIGVCNGDRGRVVAVERASISVELFASDLHPGGRLVSFSPRGYKSYEIGNATTHHKTQGASVDASVPIIDKSASAELVFMAVSRSKKALDLVLAESVWGGDLEEVARHVADRIGIKTTTRTFDEVIERTGGKETVRVTHMEREEAAKNSPLRRRWEAECKEPALAIRAERIDELRAAYDKRKADVSKDRMLSLSDRLSQERDALTSFRKAVAVVHKETQPMKYTDWKKEIDRAHELARELERHISDRREQEREKQHERELQRSIDRRYDPRRHDELRHDELEADYEFER